MHFEDINETIYRELHDFEFAQAYLEAALEEGVEEFLVALRETIQARGGMTRCAETSGITRESLYKMLSGKGNPGLRSVAAILDACGFGLSVRSLLPAAETACDAPAETVAGGLALPPMLRAELVELAKGQGLSADELSRILITAGITAMRSGGSFTAARPEQPAQPQCDEWRMEPMAQMETGIMHCEHIFAPERNPDQWKEEAVSS